MPETLQMCMKATSNISHLDSEWYFHPWAYLIASSLSQATFIPPDTNNNVGITLSSLQKSRSWSFLSCIHNTMYRWKSSVASTPPLDGLKSTQTSTISCIHEIFNCVESRLTVHWNRRHWKHRWISKTYLIPHETRSCWKSAVAIISSATGGVGLGGGHATKNDRSLSQSSTL